VPHSDDSRYEWINVAGLGDPGDVWIRGRCLHSTPLPVHAHPAGELVAYLCPDCDTQLDA
jgi:hypothetical protein